MKFRAFGILTVLAAGLGLASCSSERQMTYGGAMQPIYSIPLPDHRPVVVVGPGGSYAGTRYRRRGGCRCYAPRKVAYYKGGKRYWRVLNDPPYPPIVPKYKLEQQKAANAGAAQATVKPMRSPTGVWTVSGDQPGCRVGLSGVPSLGVQQASSRGCQGPLATVSGWRKFGTNGVELLQPGNKSAARFIENGDNRFDSLDGGNLQLRK